MRLIPVYAHSSTWRRNLVTRWRRCLGLHEVNKQNVRGRPGIFTFCVHTSQLHVGCYTISAVWLRIIFSRRFWRQRSDNNDWRVAVSYLLITYKTLPLSLISSRVTASVRRPREGWGEPGRPPALNPPVLVSAHRLISACRSLDGKSLSSLTIISRVKLALLVCVFLFTRPTVSLLPLSNLPATSVLSTLFHVFIVFRHFTSQLFEIINIVFFFWSLPNNGSFISFSHIVRNEG